jgi:hypothetical protein
MLPEELEPIPGHLHRLFGLGSGTPETGIFTAILVLSLSSLAVARKEANMSEPAMAH